MKLIWSVSPPHPAAMGFASIQLDGGIERVVEKVMNWFASSPLGSSPGGASQAEPENVSLCLGLTAQGELPGETATALALVAATILECGGSVIIPETSPLLRRAEFRLSQTSVMRSHLAYLPSRSDATS